MWMVDVVCQTMQEMYLEGDLHNILVFTIITSSSILSVFGALKHIYTYVQRNGTVHKNQTVASHSSPDSYSLPTATSDSVDVNSVQSFKALQIIDTDDENILCKEEVHQKYRQPQKKNNDLKCLSCDQGAWQRYCVHGLCDNCCEKVGWCSTKTRHSSQPHTYLPRNSCSSFGSQFIDLSNQSLKEVPVRLGFHCMRATSLSMSFNMLSHLPEHIALIRLLDHIDLSHNVISHIPAFFATFHQLTSLDLQHNRLQSFPKAILDLTSLRVLLLDHNSLRIIPYDIARLQYLQDLGLGNNLLTDIPPSVFNICSLRTLRFCRNVGLKCLPVEVKKCICLEELDLSDCNLPFLPTSLGKCSMLRQVKLKNNRLQWLPCEISQCCALTLLDVSHNPLTSLPATFLYRAPTCWLKAESCSFHPRLASGQKWILLDDVLEDKGQGDFPTLSWLAQTCVKHNDLDLRPLPIPLCEKILTYSNCFYCGHKNVPNSIRAIKYCPFPNNKVDFPLMFTFCRKHLRDNSSEDIQSQLDCLGSPNGTIISSMDLS